jgi:diguanylate cyclase (GGDEF)-like protein
MMEVATCLVREHDLRLVAVAVLVAVLGSAATMQLFARIIGARGGSRLGWIALGSVGTGTMVWCTHFVAMMAFRAEAPVTLDSTLTLISLAIPILFAAPGLAIAASRRRWLAPVGGAIIGGAISLMHYAGMAAYRVDGIVEWRWGYVVASVLLSIILSALAFRTARKLGLIPRAIGGLLLGVAVAALHFTGMAAMVVRALVLHPGQGLSDATMTALATATACASLLFIGCAAISALIDGQTQSEAYGRMRRMALHDGLTDLPNRLCFGDDLAGRLLKKGGTPFMAVVMLDLTRFKAVNDTYGHQAGDQVLIALAARMRGILQPGECIARLGGDEFGALVSYSDTGELTAFLDRLAGIFAERFAFERFSASIGANIGLALAPRDGNDADTLLARADLAMYRAKSERSPQPCFYDATMDDAVRDRRELANELREAIIRQAFELHYQVQASIATGEVTGYEVLVRWRHPTRGLIPPGLFIPLAEDIGEIIPLSEWIIHQACFEAALWPGRHPIAVNLSPLHLSDPELVSTVRQALADSGLAPERLTLELTESAIIHDRHYALDQLGALKAMGCGLALDDFGVGYSSLDVLRSFSFDRIKLDASFVADVAGNKQAVALLRSVVALGATLDIPVLAEGIEESVQLRIAAQEGCSAIQGYLIGKPSRELIDPASVRSTIRNAKGQGREVSLVA